MNIAVYSGSFDPLHIGHLAIMEYLSKDKEVDWVYLVVSPKNPLKETIKAESARDRFEAAVEAVRRYPKLHVWVDDIELNLPPPQYTIKTLDTLKQREPDNGFTLIMGADNLNGIRRWRCFERILIEYGVAVYPRKGYDVEAIRNGLIQENSEYKIRLLDAPIVDISSTQIREGLAAGKDMTEWLM